MWDRGLDWKRVWHARCEAWDHTRWTHGTLCVTLPRRFDTMACHLDVSSGRALHVIVDEKRSAPCIGVCRRLKVDRDKRRPRRGVPLGTRWARKRRGEA